ncbi:multidrug ABC transporter ATP-binding protein [Amycolatopsis antarctica]|uniref:Fatty acid ABC transporter ATP-binding/permease protein n=1 Tax=Amycolatopsis antarctica TaxID=1854586 RepID=A0A263D6S0_9PSEU|nr:ABC transporter ATP-binding protein [Amycolatopsis antarctica]OZM74160.1 multidrug ABC transporter ATP-binding protein [Amycolatopsis antarctica]
MSGKSGAVRRLLGELAPYRGRIVALVVAGMAGTTLIALVAPMVLGGATDLVLTGVRGNGVDFAALGRTLLSLAGLYVVGAVLAGAQARIAAHVVRRVVFDLRERTSAKLARLPLSHFDRHSRGDLVSRLTNDMDLLQQGLQQVIEQLAVRWFAVLGGVTMMFVVSPLLAVIVLCVMPMAGVLTARIARRAQTDFVRQRAALGALASQVDETYAAHSLVATFGRREQVERAFAERNTAVFEAGTRGETDARSIEPVTFLVTNLIYVLIATVGAARVISGALTVGQIQAFVLYCGRFGNDAGMLAALVGDVQSGLASAKRIFALLDAPEQSPDPPRRRSRGRGSGRVHFERVSFRYDPATPLIEDQSLTIEPGQTVALVGSTGGGKTTLAGLLTRFYEVDSGRITVDGADIAAMHREDVRAFTGLVPQEPWLFHGTVAENIAYGRAGATRAEVLAAARATGVDRFARTLPHGYDTVLGESAGISAGERQLINLARALLADPAILLLDEATSSVDTRSELLVARAMAAVRAGRTSLVIAHRLSTVRDADLILVMEDGRIVERGTHDELLDLCGRYARLHAAQLFPDRTTLA